MPSENVLTKYELSKKERTESVNKILESSSPKKVVVAGPGTGKTYLFKQILQNKNNTLTLTFVNSLVEDLSLELYGMSEVRTLHSYARSILSKLTNIKIKVFHKLSNIIQEDARLIINEEIDFNKLFHEREDESEHLVFYKKRRIYYDYYGYASIIFAVVKYFEKYRDKIPIYEQIVIDEFQDFNKLEVSLIDLLAEKSPILLVGDDDQALYEFKSASTKFIRERNNGAEPKYDSFTLPFCSRCTRVIVEATNDIISEAKKKKLLVGRIEKPYKYFEDEEKEKECNKYPQLTYTHQYDKQIPWFIEKKIKELIALEKKSFSVLIISPLKKQSYSISNNLQAKGFQNIDCSIKDEKELNLIDGFKLLLEDKNDVLGWRIVSKFILPENDFITLLKSTDSNPEKNILELLPKNRIDDLKKVLRVLKYLRKKKPINEEEFDKILNSLELNSFGILKEFLLNEINSTQLRMGDPAIRKIPIKSTTIQSSKGLAADFVFITHFDDSYFIKNMDKSIISDRDVCNFLVSMTRTRNKLFLISSVKEEPTFLRWIKKERYEIIES
jgi:superfamily I DNA/RNA helicase